jgi:hypothetical protein
MSRADRAEDRRARPPTWWPSEANVSRVAVSRAFNPNASLKAGKARPHPAGRARAELHAGHGGAFAGDASLASGRGDRAGCLQPLGKPGDRRADHRAAGGRVSPRLLFKAKADFSMDHDSCSPICGASIRIRSSPSPRMFEPDVLERIPRPSRAGLCRSMNEATTRGCRRSPAGFTSLFDRLVVRAARRHRAGGGAPVRVTAPRVAYLGGKRAVAGQYRNAAAHDQRDSGRARHAAGRSVVEGDYTYDTCLPTPRSICFADRDGRRCNFRRQRRRRLRGDRRAPP